MADPAIRSVPDQAKVVVRRGAAETGYRMDAELRSFGKLLKRWRHQEIGDARRSRRLSKADRAYTVAVDVVFTTATEKTATFIVEVIESNGSSFAKKQVVRKGKKPETASGVVRISMKS